MCQILNKLILSEGQRITIFVCDKISTKGLPEIHLRIKRWKDFELKMAETSFLRPELSYFEQESQFVIRKFQRIHRNSGRPIIKASHTVFMSVTTKSEFFNGSQNQ